MTRSLLSRIARDLSTYTGENVTADALDLHADPNVRACTAVRWRRVRVDETRGEVDSVEAREASQANGDEHVTFLYHDDASEAVDRIEECEFTVWPPRSLYDRDVAAAERSAYGVAPLSFSDQLIAVEDGEIDEDESTRASVDDEGVALTYATSPEECANALREMLGENIDVERHESFSEAGILHNAPYESGLRITLANGCTFVITVTQQ